jgi:hypothetical protein
MTEYQLEDEKSQESSVDRRGMWHRLDKQPDDSKPARIYTLLLSVVRSHSRSFIGLKAKKYLRTDDLKKKTVTP